MQYRLRETLCSAFLSLYCTVSVHIAHPQSVLNTCVLVTGRACGTYRKKSITQTEKTVLYLELILIKFSWCTEFSSKLWKIVVLLLKMVRQENIHLIQIGEEKLYFIWNFARLGFLGTKFLKFLGNCCFVVKNGFSWKLLKFKQGKNCILFGINLN